MALAKKQIQRAFIQSEIDDLHQRTHEEIKTARRNRAETRLS